MVYSYLILYLAIYITAISSLISKTSLTCTKFNQSSFTGFEISLLLCSLPISCSLIIAACKYVQFNIVS